MPLDFSFKNIDLRIVLCRRLIISTNLWSKLPSDLVRIRAIVVSLVQIPAKGSEKGEFRVLHEKDRIELLVGVLGSGALCRSLPLA